MSNFIHKVFNPFLSPAPHHNSQKETELLTPSLPPPSPTTGPDALEPVTVIELFQSQGCNSCPPANAALVARASQSIPAELLLTYEVTYWDYLGWVDTFGDARWDARQTAYARALRQRSCYTPQVIVDGGARPMGSSWRNLSSVLAAAKAGPVSRVGFDLVGEGGRRGLKVTGGEGRALVLVVYYEAEPKSVKILRGENMGETERYRNMVRDLKLLGTWDGGELVVELPERRNGLEMAVLVQAGNGGPILGAVRV
jgi:hypothetical protein